MRAAALLLALLLAAPAWAQAPARKPVEKKTAAKKPARATQAAGVRKAHRKPTPEQIKRFDRLEGKRGQR